MELNNFQSIAFTCARVFKVQEFYYPAVRAIRLALRSSYCYRNRRGGASATIAETRARLSKRERRTVD